MRAALILAGKDLRLRIRDRSVFIVGVLAPFALAFIFSLILGPVASGEFRPHFGVVDLDGGRLAGGFVGVLKSLDAGGVIELEALADPPAARDAVRRGELDAVFVLPAGMTSAITAGRSARMEVVGNPDAPTSTAIAVAIAQGFATEVRSVSLAVATALAGGVEEPAPSLAAEAAATPAPISLDEVTAATRELDLTTFFVAGMGIFFLFFTVSFGVMGLLEERNGGTLARLMAAPIPRWAVLAGKMSVAYLVGVGAMTILIVSSSLLLGARWGNPWGVALLVLAATAAAEGITAVVAAFARTAEAASTLQSIIAVGLGMLGGIFFPTSLGNGIIATLSYVTPHRWFMSGLADLAGGGGARVVLPAVGALLAFAAVTTVPALLRLRHLEVR